MKPFGAIFNKIICEFVAIFVFCLAGAAQNHSVVINGTYLVLNGGKSGAPIYAVVNQPSDSGIIRTSSGGWILSEAEYNYIQWNIGKDTGMYVVPFGYSATNYLPLSMHITTGGTVSSTPGNILFSTYRTNDIPIPNNLPWPFPVGNLNNTSGTNNSLKVVDRWWIINTNNYSANPASTLSFTYTPAELGGSNTITELNLRAQRWNSILNLWDFIDGTDNNITHQVVNVKVSPANLYRAWMLVDSIACTAIAASISGKNTLCKGDSALLTASGGTSYKWSTGATTSSVKVTPVTTTTYSVSVSNGACVKDTSITVTVNTKPIPTVSGTQTICAGSSATLTATGGSSYTWMPATGLSSTTIFNPTASPSATTVYTVVVSNGGCSAKDSVKVIVNPAASGAACCSATITSGQTTPLSVTPVTSGYIYNWTPAAGLSCTTCANPIASPTVTTTYYVTITDSQGCSRRDSVIITVLENCGEVFVPNAFSPNGDGHNDVLYVRGECIKNFDFIIYDRWGNKVFETTDQGIGWDGIYKGQAMNTGTYAYYLNALTQKGNIVKKGNVTLVR